jgi:zinc protease
VPALKLLAAMALLPAVALAGRLELPPLTTATLPNGLAVYVVPDRRLPLVEFRLVARAGSVDDPVGKEGLADLTAELLTQGAGRRDARQIAEDIAFVGGTLEASSSAEQLVVTCEVLEKDFDTGLELLRDVIVSPTFPEAEFERKRAETLGALAAMKDDPSEVADAELDPFLWGAGPLGHPSIGWPKSVSALSRADVAAFHRRFITPDRAWLAVVGDVDAQPTLAAIARAFGGWKRPGEKILVALETMPPGGPRQVLVVSKPEVTQTQFRLGCAGAARDDPDFYAITVANTILGGGFTSRLVDEVRVKLGLTYGIHSAWNMFRDAGSFEISSFTKNASLRQAVDATLGEVRKLVDRGPTPAELEKAKRYLTGQFPLGLQAPDALAAQILEVAFYGLPADYLETFRDRIDAVTMDDVRRVLAKRFCVDELKLLVVSNPETAGKALAGLGPIRVKEME